MPSLRSMAKLDGRQSGSVVGHLRSAPFGLQRTSVAGTAEVVVDWSLAALIQHSSRKDQRGSSSLLPHQPRVGTCSSYSCMHLL